MVQPRSIQEEAKVKGRADEDRRFGSFFEKSSLIYLYACHPQSSAVKIRRWLIESLDDGVLHPHADLYLNFDLTSGHLHLLARHHRLGVSCKRKEREREKKSFYA